MRFVSLLQFAPTVNVGGGDVGVPEPFLDVGDIGIVIKRIGAGGRAQRVRADLET